MMSWLWNAGQQSSSTDDIKYHGLFNQGATCYLNSVLQVLFMTRDFREAVERCTPDNHDAKCIDHQLRDMFESLQTGTARTYEITEKLGIDKVYEQRDAAEYFEKILALASPEASQIFHGVVTRKITCCQCKTVTRTDGTFLHLPIGLVDSHSEHRVEDGIKEYFRTSHFSGENQMYCEECDTKSDAAIECALKDHPEVLTLLLKRFDFDYNCMSYVKNNNVVEFPCTLPLQQNQTYEVYAYVEHTGDLRYGHYTAMIKSQENGRWYNFNDTSVTLHYDQPFRHDNTERSGCVYLLFYRKKKHFHTQGISEGLTNGAFLLPAAGDDQDECPDVKQMRETRTEDSFSDGSSGVDPICNVEDPDRGPLNDQHCNEEGSDTCYYLTDETQKELDAEVMMEEEEGGKTKESEDQAEKGSGLLSTEAHLEEKEEDMNFCNADIYQDLKPEGSNRDVMHESVNEEEVVRLMGYEGSENNIYIEMTNEEEEGESVQDQDEGMLEGVRQDGPEEKTTHEEVAGEEQAKESPDSSQLRMEKLRENLGGEGVEKLGNSPPAERAGCKDATAEGGGGSEKTKLGTTKFPERHFHDESILLLDNQPCESSKTEKSQSVHLLPKRKEKTAESRDVISNTFSPPATRGNFTDVSESQLLPVETQLAKSKEDQNHDRGKQNPVKNRPQKASIHNRIDPEHTNQIKSTHRPHDNHQTKEKKMFFWCGKRKKNRKRGGYAPSLDRDLKMTCVKRDEGDAQYIQNRRSDRRGQAENQGDNSSENEYFAPQSSGKRQKNKKMILGCFPFPNGIR